MAERNLLLGGGEKLTGTAKIKDGGGDKKLPYELAQIRSHIHKPLKDIRANIESLPPEAKPRGEGVFELILHPAFLARSYFPQALLGHAELRSVGSKETVIVPKAVTNPRQEGKKQATATLFLAGSTTSLTKFSTLLMADNAPVGVKKALIEIESVRWIPGNEKFKGILPTSKDVIAFEVALHAREADRDIIEAFGKFAVKVGAIAEVARRITVGGLTFLPVKGTAAAIQALMAFAFLRVARVMPALRAAPSEVSRKNRPEWKYILPPDPAIDSTSRVAIFDGGLGTTDLAPWAKEITFRGTQATSGNLLLHGNEVTSTFLFGRASGDGAKLRRPYMNVDHYRVLGPQSGKDPDLFDVLHLIKKVLETGKYKFANLSIGPRMPIEDDEVHPWTATLDQLCGKHKVFATVAVGNDGEATGANRVQPPGDMVNAIAVGAADSAGVRWKRAPYSCVGPGRSPGFVKPDGVAFGGSAKEKFHVYNPMLKSIVGVEGTSFSSPLTLRTAVGVDTLTTFDLDSIAIKALMIHHAKVSGRQKREEIGWGRFEEEPMAILECAPGTVTVIFKDKLARGEYRRCPIPFPDVALPGKVTIRATFCLSTVTDPEHALNYTRTGMGIVFRPRLGIDEEDSDGFFGRGTQYKTEREMRSGSHKWETVLHRERKFEHASALSAPVFDVEYHAREESRAVTYKKAPEVAFALIVTLSAEGVSDIYDLIRQKYPVLLPVELRTDIGLDAS